MRKLKYHNKKKKQTGEEGRVGSVEFVRNAVAAEQPLLRSKKQLAIE